MLVPDTVELSRVVAHPDFLDSAVWSGATHVARIAPDEVWVIGTLPDRVLPALELMDTAFLAVRLDSDQLAWLQTALAWTMPEPPRPAVGSLEGVPIVVVHPRIDGKSPLLLIPRSLWHELMDRVG